MFYSASRSISKSNVVIRVAFRQYLQITIVSIQRQALKTKQNIEMVEKKRIFQENVFTGKRH